MNKPIITVLMPHFSPQIYTEVFLSVAGLIRHPFISDKLSLILPQKQTQSIAEIRNTEVTIALEQDCTHLLFLDGDQLYPKNLIDVLVSHNKDIIGGWSMIRSANHPNVYNWKDEKKKVHVPIHPRKLTKVDRLGFGCMLIKREVFENLDPPWFKYDEGHRTEDLYFCDMVKETGYDIWVDGDMKCAHIDITYR